MKRILIFFILLTPFFFIPNQVSACSCYDKDDNVISVDNEAECVAACSEDSATEGADGDGTCICSDRSEEINCSDLCEDAGYSYTSSTATSSSGAPTVSYPTPQLNIDIPGVDFVTPVVEKGYLQSNFIGTYISGLYKFLIGFAIVVAIVMMMIGGLQYVAGATSGDIEKAKSRIRNAVEGFVLLLFVYVILFTVNPELTLFKNLNVLIVAEVPTEHLINDADSTTSTCTGTACNGVSAWQDCMLKKYGASAEEVKAQLVTVSFQHNGKKRNYQVHKLMAEDFTKALEAIKASGTSYDITRDTSGGTFSWRANKNKPSVLSNHSWGSAIDINPDKNPNCPSKCFDGDTTTACSCVTSSDCQKICESRKGDLPKEVIDAFINNNFDWLGDRQTSAKPNVMQDFMHFDYKTGC